MKQWGNLNVIMSSRRNRILVILGTYLGYAAMVAWWSFSNTLAAHWPFYLVIPFGFIAIMSWFTLTGSVYGKMMNSGEAALDERELAARNRAHTIAYGILSALVLIASLYLYIAVTNGTWWLPTTDNELSATYWVVILIVSSLPAAVIAGLEPDPVQDDEALAEQGVLS